MKPFLQMGIGAAAAVAVSVGFILQSNFGESRHTLSIIGAIAILIASLYILRTRLIRWGNRSRLLKYHQGLASFGLCLVLIHSGVKPETWHSWADVLPRLAEPRKRGRGEPDESAHPAHSVALPFGVGAHLANFHRRSWARET